MITCERCNTDNLEGSQYCDECGAALNGAGGGRAKISDVEHAAGGPSAMSGGAAIAEVPNIARSEKAAQPWTASTFASSAGSDNRSSSIGRSSSSKDNASAGGINGFARAVHAKLVIQRGRSSGKEFNLSDDETQIGRWDADGGIFPDVDLDTDDPDAKVSRRHARITHRAEQYFIEDLGSTNGTYINRGRRLLPGDRQPLRDGDEIIVGKTFLRFFVIK